MDIYLLGRLFRRYDEPYPGQTPRSAFENAPVKSSGIERLDPSVCPSRCNKSSGTWVRVVPGVCLNINI